MWESFRRSLFLAEICFLLKSLIPRSAEICCLYKYPHCRVRAGKPPAGAHGFEQLELQCQKPSWEQVSRLGSPSWSGDNMNPACHCQGRAQLGPGSSSFGWLVLPVGLILKLSHHSKGENKCEDVSEEWDDTCWAHKAPGPASGLHLDTCCHQGWRQWQLCSLGEPCALHTPKIPFRRPFALEAHTLSKWDQSFCTRVTANEGHP